MGARFGVTSRDCRNEMRYRACIVAWGPTTISVASSGVSLHSSTPTNQKSIPFLRIPPAIHIGSIDAST